MKQPRAIIIGASYAGLISAVALQCNGWDVQVIERSRERLRTGGGVVVQRRMAEYLEQQGISFPTVPSVPARTRQFFRPDGTVLRMPEDAAVYTAWDVLLRAVESLLGTNHIVRGVEMVDLSRSQDKAEGWVLLDDGTRRTADLVVAADGIGSRARRILLPGVEPEWSGYVAWRGMVEESQISDITRATLGDSLNSFSGSNVPSRECRSTTHDGSGDRGDSKSRRRIASRTVRRDRPRSA